MIKGTKFFASTACLIGAGICAYFFFESAAPPFKRR
jgi:hypothetical protein